MQIQMDKIYYISQGDTANKQLENIRKVCRGGVRLVQLRMKNVTEETYIATARKAIAICRDYKALLVVNDNLVVAKESGADGLHLGKNDIRPEEARKQFSGFIGGTANTLQDCNDLLLQGVDYIGLGPFRYTQTKRNLSPILGLEGILSVLENLKNKAVPVYAIGGILTTDFPDLFCTGIHGVALSGMLTMMQEEEIKEFMQQFLK